MKVLLIGGCKIDRAAEAVGKMAGVDPITATNVDTIREFGSAGVRVDRVILFEQAITNDGIFIDKESVRKRTQSLIAAIRESFENFDLVCAADNIVVKQAMLEEIFELKSRACVIYCKDNRISTGTLAALIGETIINLIEQYKANEVDKSIYRSVKSVKWSSEVDHETLWDNAGIVASHNLIANTKDVRFNEKTGKFEKVDVADNEQGGGTPGDFATENRTEHVEAEEKRKKKWLFGNRRL